VRNKQITLLLPDSEVHGVFTQAMVNDSVTDQWVQKWKLEKNLTEWASEWGVKEVNTPTASEIRNALFKQPPLEWSRITHFQDRTMVLMCQRLLPETERRDIYLQGTVSFKLPKGYVPSRVYCSPHNPGAREIAGELNAFVEANSRTNSRRISSFRSSRQTVVSRACGSRISRVTRRKTHGDGVSGRLLEVVEVGSWSDLGNCDHMLICLNAQTWSLEAETLAADIREAMREGLHLQLCHEFPSVLDPDTQRHAIEFKQIMDMTPVDLRKGQTNIYRQIAIPLKAGALREPGLAHLASRLARYAPRESVHLGDPAASQRSTRRLQKLRSKKRRAEQQGRQRWGHPAGRDGRSPRLEQSSYACIQRVSGGARARCVLAQLGAVRIPVQLRTAVHIPGFNGQCHAGNQCRKWGMLPAPTLFFFAEPEA